MKTWSTGALLLLTLASCGGDGPSSPSPSTTTTTTTTATTTTVPPGGSTTTTTPTTVPTSTVPPSTTTVPPSGPRTQFGAGQYRVNVDIVAGRYFSDPITGCYWERQSGLGGTFGEIIANDAVSFNSAQNIVDILSSDVAFEADAQCGTWFQTPRHGFQSTIVGGTWLVGAQVAAGTYVANVTSGCYWERLRNFTHRGIDGVIANDFVDSAGQQFVAISASDAGFYTNDRCGTWTRTNAIVSPRPQSPSEIQRNQELHRQRNGAGRRF